MSKPLASIDTSFFAHSYIAEVVYYLCDYFDVLYCTEVKREATARNPEFPEVVYPNVRLFELLCETELFRHADPGTREAKFQPGESQAMALARERNAVLLIDDHRPLCYAQAQGIATLSTPDFVLKLCRDGKLPAAICQRLLAKLQGRIAPELLNGARRGIEAIQRRRGY